MVINNNAISIHNTTPIYNESWARAIPHSSEDRQLHYGTQTECRTIPGNNL
jgi:hypothetical protein